MVDRKHIIGLILAVVVLTIIGMVLLWPKLTASSSSSSSSTSSTDHNQLQAKHVKQPNTLSSILLSTSTASVPQPKKTKQVRSSHNKCLAKYGNKTEWSVRIEASTNSVGSPRNVIKEWQFHEKMKEEMDHRYRLHKNGSFYINEKGIYRIQTQVTFKDDAKNDGGKNDYFVQISGSSSSNKLDSEKQVNTKNGDRVVVFEFCMNITENLSFFLRLPNSSLIYLFPEKTYFIVKKMK